MVHTVLTVALGLIIAASGGTDDRIAVSFFTPSGELNYVRSSEVLSFIDRTVDDHTDLSVSRLDPAAANDCRGRLSCLIQRARPDYDRSVYFLPDGGVAPFAEHEEYLTRRNLSVARYILLISGVGSPEGDNLTFTLVDADAALKWRHPRDTVNLAAETELREAAVLGRPFRAEVRGGPELQRILERFVSELLRPELETRGRWNPFGTITVSANVEGAAVYVDDTLRVTTSSEPVVVDRLRPGPVELRLEHPGFMPLTATVDVRRNRDTAFDAVLLPLPSETGRRVRTGTIWSGAILMASGAAFIIAGAVDAANDDTRIACEGCSGARFKRLSTTYDPDDPTAPPAESGPLTIPLGYSLAITGASWTFGSLLTKEDKVPWIPLAVGLAAGALSYGLSEALRDDPG